MGQDEVFLYVYVPLIIVIAVIICLLPGCISNCISERQARDSAELAQWRMAAAAERTSRLAAAAAAPAVKKELGYFPYSAVVEGGRARAAGERQQLVCAICLEAFVPGATCSEVPTCRHFFHRDCIGTWMKNSKSTCPLCRAFIVPGSGRLSAAEDMV